MNEWLKPAVCAVIGLASVTNAAAASCEAKSGDTRAALVELYTSEGCSSCPPADQALVRLGPEERGVRVVPIALHVDYWDSIGWKDPFAQAPFAERQRWEVRANGRRTSFTPHFFVNGREVEDWRADLSKEIAKPAAGPGARIDIRAQSETARALRLRVDGTSDRRHEGTPLQLYVAVTENRLSSQVVSGENRGVRLEHDHVVRHWIGPIAVSGGRVAIDRVVDVPQLANGNVSVTAFLQDARTAEVVQAVSTGLCRST